MEVEWTNEMAIRLVQEYRDKPELWDPTHDLYRVQTAKYEAWSGLARVFECDIGDVRKKLNSIFASHRREKAKVRSGGRSTWFLYNYMNFLPTHLDHGNIHKITNMDIVMNPPAASSQASNDDESEASCSADEDIEEPVVVKQEPVQYKKLVYKHNKNVRIRPPVKRRIAKDSIASQLDARLRETLKLLRKSDLSRKKDECDSFGDYIAVSLRKHDQRTQCMIKQAINNIMFEQEMKKYNTGHYAVVISNIDENPLLVQDEDK